MVFFFSNFTIISTFKVYIVSLLPSVGLLLVALTFFHELGLKDQADKTLKS